MAIIWLSAFLLFVALNWLSAARSNTALEYIVKPAASAALLLFAASGDSPSPWLLVALTCCLVGDVYLMLPGDYFIAGLSAFLFGHVAYNLTFSAGLAERLVWFAVVAALCLPAIIPIVRALKDRLLKAGVIVYMGVICLMAGSAIATGSLVAGVGALLFIASDTLIAWDMFVKKIPRAHLWVMVSYHVAQLFLVFALRAA